MRIAFSGVFDIANYGDHLYPLVFKQQMRKNGLECELFLFSCNDGKQALGVDTPVYALRDLEEMHLKYNFDAIVVAGGWIAHFILGKQKLCSTNEYYDDYPIYESWIIPSLIALKHNVTLIWNAPDSYYNFSPVDQDFLRGLCSSIDYISVRSQFSVDTLIIAGIERERIHLVPDTALLLPQVIPQEELLSIRKELLTIKGDYIVYHATKHLPESELENIFSMLNQLMEQGFQIVLLPLAYTHDDQSILRMIYEKGAQRYVYFDRELVLKEQIAVLAGCSLYIGESFHGAVTTFSYHIPAVIFNHLQQKKQDELFSMFKAEKYLVVEGEKLQDTVQIALQHYDVNPDLISQKQHVIENHFTKVALTLQETPNKKLTQKFICGFVDGIADLSKANRIWERERSSLDQYQKVKDMLQWNQSRVDELGRAIAWHHEYDEQLKESVESKEQRIVELEAAIVRHKEYDAQLEEAIIWHKEHDAQLEAAIAWHKEHDAQLEAAIAWHKEHDAQLQEAIKWHKERNMQMEEVIAKAQHKAEQLEICKTDLEKENSAYIQKYQQIKSHRLGRWMLRWLKE